LPSQRHQSRMPQGVRSLFLAWCAQPNSISSKRLREPNKSCDYAHSIFQANYAIS
jgi:hypothetical protein